jgi:hypothetical protein
MAFRPMSWLGGLGAAVLAMWAVPARADSLSCNGKIVSDGERAYDLVAKCGEPDSRETHQEDFGDLKLPQRTSVTVEEWTYNFGPSDFVRIVTVKNGVITRIRTGRYGYEKTAEPKRSCDEQVAHLGDTRTDIAARCGEPSWKDSHDEAITEGERTVYVTVEEWTYDLGRHRFVRILTFRNGKLTQMRSGDYGHSDP